MTSIIYLMRPQALAALHGSTKRDLDLGKSLVVDFVREFLPDDLEQVRRYFSHRGAYRCRRTPNGSDGPFHRSLTEPIVRPHEA